MVSINPRHLHYLIMLAKAGSFSEAAASARISQSTLTVAIQGLEEELGGVLIDRSHRRVRLTPFGEAVAQQAERILDQIQQLPSLAAVTSKPLATKLRLGIVPSIAPFALPRLLPALRENYPDLQLQVREGLTQGLLQDITRGELNAAFIAHVPPADEFEHAVIARDPFFLAVPGKHRLAGLNEATAQHLVGEKLLLLGHGHCLREHVLMAVERENGVDVEDVRAHSITTLVQLVENGMGVTLLPGIALKSGATAGTGLNIIPFEAPHASRKLVLVWRNRSLRDADFEALARLLRELFQEC